MQSHPAISKLNELLNIQNQTPIYKIHYIFKDFFQFSYPNRIGGIQDEIFAALKNQIHNNGIDFYLGDSIRETIKSLYAASSKDKFFYPHSLEVSSPEEIQSGIIDLIKFLSEKCQYIDGSDQLSKGILFQKIILENKSLWWPPALRSIKCDTNNPDHDFIYLALGSIGGQDFNNISQHGGGNVMVQFGRTMEILKHAPIEVTNHSSFFKGFIEEIKPTYLSLPCVLSMRPSKEIPNLDEFLFQISDDENDLKTSFFVLNQLPFLKENADLWTPHIIKSTSLQNIIKKLMEIPKILAQQKHLSGYSNALEYFNHFEHALLHVNLESLKTSQKPKSL